MCLEMDSDTKLDMVVLLDRPWPGGGPFDIDQNPGGAKLNDGLSIRRRFS